MCVGLMNVFAGTLSPITVAQQPTTGPSTAFHTTARTTDGKFTAALTVNPNIADPDAFDVMVAEAEMG